MTTLGIIPARAGSKRFPGKHQEPLRGRPLIAYCLEAARAAHRLDRVVLSTDDDALFPIAKEWGVEAMPRPEELAQDTSSLDDVFRQVCRHLEGAEGYRPDVVVALGGNVPVRKPGQIDEVVARLAALGEATAVGTAVVERSRPEWAKRYDPDTGRIEPFMAGVEGFRKQDFPPLCRLDGVAIAVRRDVLMATPDGARVPHAWLGDRVHVLLQEHPMYALEVDYPDELALAAFYLAYREQGDALLARLDP